MSDGRKVKVQGIKKTKYRTRIYDIFEKSEQPLSAEQVFLKMKAEGSPINISTVYRIISLLWSKNILVKSVVSDTAFFELNRNEHTHRFICSGCEKMFKFEGCPFEAYQKRLEAGMGFDVTGHKFEVYGLCSECKNKKD